MDLVGAIVGMRQSSLASQIQFRVARKMLDVQEMQGQAALKLLEAATVGVDRGAGEVVAAASGLGGELDVYG